MKTDLPFAGIEAGGTKFVCLVGSGPDDIRARGVIPTKTPEETIAEVVTFLLPHAPFTAIGIGTFGPCDLDPASPTFGHLTTTPKTRWEGFDMAGAFRRVFHIPVAMDTDVNAAALGEHRWGAGRGCDIVVYLTVGTGIGGGAVIRGTPLHGLVHPEMGHIVVPRDRDPEALPGVCPYHPYCLQGLAAGPAMEARWGRPASDLAPDHPAWTIEARYLAYAVSNFIYVLSPNRVILGGGVMHQRHLFPLIRTEVKSIVNGYVRSPMILERIDEYIVPPALGDDAGVLGAIALAMEADR
ncbi:MAG TPA: ROK family protein [Thermodesulfobacteriota bacterium]|nr:ROK family protein [Thermodesulfobacteriota bacterium]